MKKLLGCFLCVMLLVFGAAASVQALTIICEGSSCNTFGVDEINGVISNYNTTHSPDLPLVSSMLDQLFDSAVDGNDVTSINVAWPSNTLYVSFKYATYCDLWYVLGTTGGHWDSSVFNPNGNNYFALSNIKTWGDGTSVPDASIMLLLGFSLLGFGIFSRKCKKS